MCGLDDALVDAACALGLERGENGAVECPVKRRHGPVLVNLAARFGMACVRVCVCLCARGCVLCVCARACVCVCVRVCVCAIGKTKETRLRGTVRQHQQSGDLESESIRTHTHTHRPLRGRGVAVGGCGELKPGHCGPLVVAGKDSGWPLALYGEGGGITVECPRSRLGLLEEGAYNQELSARSSMATHTQTHTHANPPAHPHPHPHAHTRAHTDKTDATYIDLVAVASRLADKVHNGIAEVLVGLQQRR